jgi:hypothetical protein
MNLLQKYRYNMKGELSKFRRTFTDVRCGRLLWHSRRQHVSLVLATPVPAHPDQLSRPRPLSTLFNCCKSCGSGGTNTLSFTYPKRRNGKGFEVGWPGRPEHQWHIHRSSTANRTLWKMVVEVIGYVSIPVWWGTVLLQNEVGYLFFQLGQQPLGQHVDVGAPYNGGLREGERPKHTAVGYGAENVTFGESRSCCSVARDFSVPQNLKLCLLTLPHRWNVASSVNMSLASTPAISSRSCKSTQNCLRFGLSVGFSPCIIGNL